MDRNDNVSDYSSQRRENSNSTTATEAMQRVTAEGGEGVAGEGSEEDEGGDGVGQAIVCFYLKSLISVHYSIECLKHCLHMVSLHRRSRHSCQN